MACPLSKTHAEEVHPPTTGATTHATATAHEGSAAHEDPSEDLMPNFLSTTSIMSEVWVLIIFGIVLAILYKTAWKQILAGLKAREDRIRGDIAAAEATRAKAEATLKEYNNQLATAEQRVRDMITAATADAERMAAQIRTRGEQEANDVKDRATKEIEAAKKQALTEIYDQTATLATSVAEKILRRSLNADDQRDLVTRSLEQVSNIKNN
jgi:F-type H+-transporting ATPase subunit b